MRYTDLDAFIRDLPRLAAGIADRLRGHDLLALVETREGRSVHIRLKDGQAEVSEAAEDKPDCTVTADEATLLEIIRGELNPMKALLLRRVKVRGNVQALMGLIALL